MPARGKETKNFTTITDVDRLIHEPARLLILSYLYVVESADFLFLLRQTNLTRGNLSSHLMKLEKAGYVNIEKKFVDKIPRTLLSLTKEGRKAFHEYSQRMKKIFRKLPG
ncbi:hypothetical protein AYK25_07450 [Thermoplasmatales archaeon SM1-50]|nr:MAG: hypothetical protein AYK25_07450 [Thermoplasmatales archaeon SM1-50]